MDYIKIHNAIEVEKLKGVVGSTQYIVEGDSLTLTLLDSTVLEAVFVDLRLSAYEEQPDELLVRIDGSLKVLSVDEIKDINQVI